MSTFKLKRLLALLTTSLFLATGCTQLQSVPLQRAGQGIEKPNVNVGESVVVTTNDGRKHAFKVTAVETDALRGDRERVAYADIMAIDARRPGNHSGTKTALIIGAAVAVAVLVASGGGGSTY